MKKLKSILIFCSIMSVWACKEATVETEFITDNDVELRGLEDDFYDIFRHPIYQEMPENLAQENAFKTVFAAALSQFFLEKQYGMWDVYAPIRVCWDLSDELYLQEGNSSVSFDMEPAEMFNDWSGVSGRALSDYEKPRLTYPYMVEKLYNPYKSIFNSVPGMFKDIEFQRFFLIHNVDYDPSYATEQCDRLYGIIDQALQYRDPAIFYRPFDNCFTMADGFQGLIVQDPARRRVFTAIQKALEAMMGIDNQYDRVQYAKGVVTNLRLMESTPNFESLFKPGTDDIDMLDLVVTTAAYTATFWKVYYGMEEEGANPREDDPLMDVTLVDGRRFPAEGGELKLLIMCNYPWDLYDLSHEEVNLSVESGDAGQTPLTVFITPNNDGRSRTIRITLQQYSTNRRVREIITLTQPSL